MAVSHSIGRLTGTRPGAIFKYTVPGFGQFPGASRLEHDRRHAAV